jgi:preprotein translocase SecF subunit
MPLRLFPNKTNYDFMGRRWHGFSISIIITVMATIMLFLHGLNLGIDFTGGILMEIHTEKPEDLGHVREKLSGHNLGEISLQNLGSPNDIMIRIQISGDEEQGKIIAQVKNILGEAIKQPLDYRKIDFVGPTIGGELVRGGILAVLGSFASIMCYVWLRFEWQYGVGAILALFHDTIMMIGFFAITQFEFGLTALAAILTVIGYSINDSVVIYDRIRENMRRYKKMSVFDLINRSMNDTLSRTILTASTTLLAALALAIFGGEVIRGFSAAMVFGVLIGTHSSIFISAPALYYLNLRPHVPEPQPA